MKRGNLLPIHFAENLVLAFGSDPPRYTFSTFGGSSSLIVDFSSGTRGTCISVQDEQICIGVAVSSLTSVSARSTTGAHKTINSKARCAPDTRSSNFVRPVTSFYDFFQSRRHSSTNVAYIKTGRRCPFPCQFASAQFEHRKTSDRQRYARLSCGLRCESQ
jgi:hypothetical protein